MMRTVCLLLAVVCAAALPASAPAETKPTIAIIGTGDMGDSLGPRFAELGYKVIYGSRDPEGSKIRMAITCRCSKRPARK